MGGTIGTMISITRLAKMAEPGSGESDEAVLASFLSYRPSYNADAAFQRLLGASCAIGLHRPQLLDRLLPRALGACVAMGVTTLEDFWRYAEFCAVRGLETPRPAVQDFTETTTAFLRQELPKYEALLSRLLQDRLAQPD
jgi:hypothetical protein